MPNIKSAKKRVKQSEKARIRNHARKSEMRTAVKKVLEAVEQKDSASAKDLLRIAQSKLARSRGKGVMHRNTMARKMSRLAKQVKSIEA